MEYTIYLRTNNKNGKHYVGQTSDFKRRENQWNCLKLKYANKHILKDRELYGLDNWSVEILAECDTREEAWQLEQYYIEHYNTVYPNGYNLSKGGGGTNGCHFNFSEEHRKKLSENNCKYWLDKHLSDESRKKMSEAKKGENHPKYWLGKQRSEETKKKISEARKGKQINRQDLSKKVYQYTLDGKLVKVWESVNECGRNGFKQGAVSQCCRGKLKTHKGYIWSYVPL